MKIAIAGVTPNVVSETFIQRHLKELPFNCVPLCGGSLDLNIEGNYLFPEQLPTRIKKKLLNKLCGLDLHYDKIKKQSKWLNHNGIKCVLAEYGVNAAKILPACKLANVPLIAHFHGYDAHSNDILKEYNEPYQELFAYSHAIIGVSHAMCKQLEQFGAPKEKVHYIPCSVDTTQFLCTDATANPPLFLAVGRFVEKKAPHLTILAFSKVAEKHPEARLEMVGDGQLLGACKKLVAALGIQDRVAFHGPQAHTFVAEAMQRARCFVQHSVVADNGDSEGTPVAILEAQASGLPVIATKHTGIADVALHNETGFLVNETDIQDMASHMLKIANTPQLATTLGKAGRTRVENHFGYNQTLGKLAEVIQSAIR